MQAAALRGAGGQTMQPGQQQQQQQQQQQGGAAAPTGGPPKPPNGLPDWAAAAAANGMLNLGTDREAIMKQVSTKIHGGWRMARIDTAIPVASSSRIASAKSKARAWYRCSFSSQPGPGRGIASICRCSISRWW
jgi:hypothetical protein